MLHSTLMPTAFSALWPEDGLTYWALPEPQNQLHVHAECGICVFILSTFVKLVWLAHKWCWMFFGLCIFVRSIHYQTFSYLSLLACLKKSEFSFMERLSWNVKKSGLNSRIKISVIEALCKPHDFPSDSEKSVINKEVINTYSRSCTYMISLTPQSGGAGESCEVGIINSIYRQTENLIDEKLAYIAQPVVWSEISRVWISILSLQ